MTEQEMDTMAAAYANEVPRDWPDTLNALERAVDALGAMRCEVRMDAIAADTWMVLWQERDVDGDLCRQRFLGERFEPLRSVLVRWYLQD